MVGDRGEDRWKVLFDRAVAACEEAAGAIRRSSELHALITSVALDNVVCCAWCGRIGPNARAVAPPSPDGAAKRFSAWRVPPSERRRLSHGICPQCYERVAAAAATERAAARTDNPQ